MKFLNKFHDPRYEKIAFYVTRTALITFILGIVVYKLSGAAGTVMAFISSILQPLLLGVVLAYMFTPIAAMFERRVFKGIQNAQQRRLLAVILTFAVVILALVLILTLLIVTVTKSISAINLSDITVYVESLQTELSEFWNVLQTQLASWNISIGSLSSRVTAIISGLSSGVSTLLFANIFAIYFMLDAGIRTYWEKALEVLLSDKTREKLRAFMKDADRVFSGYIRGQVLDASLVGLLVSIALLLAGVPYAAVIGLLTGVGNLIPYVGPVVGFGSLIVVCLSSGSLQHLLLGAIILIAVLAIDGNVINPRLLSKNVEIHPALVVVALLAGGNVGGVAGMLIAVPCAALIKLQFEKYLEKKRAEKAAGQV